MSLVTRVAEGFSRLVAAINVLKSGKQDTLVSGTNIKTINSTSILGSGDIVVQGPLPSSQAEVDAGLIANKYVAPDTLQKRLENFQLTDGVGNLAILLKFTTNSTIKRGDIIAGSNLRYTGFNVYTTTSNVSYIYNASFGAAPAGTWQALGTISFAQANTCPATLFIRIA